MRLDELLPTASWANEIDHHRSRCQASADRQNAGRTSNDDEKAIAKKSQCDEAVGRRLLSSACIRSAERAPVWQPSAGHTQMPTWPGTPPHMRAGPNTESTGRGAPIVAGRPWLYIRNVSRPTLTVGHPRAGWGSGVDAPLSRPRLSSAKRTRYRHEQDRAPRRRLAWDPVQVTGQRLTQNYDRKRGKLR